MKQMLYILFCIALCGTLYGKHIESLSVEVQRHVDVILSAAKSNDWVSARKEYDQINWQEVKKPAKILKILSKGLNDNKDCKDLRKEIKTKYQLLREEDDVDLEDSIVSTPIPIVQFEVTRFPAIEFGELELITIDTPIILFPGLKYISLDVNAIVIPGLKYTYLDIITLNPEVLKTLGIIIPVVDSQGVSVVILRIKDEKFIALMELWEHRYSRQLDFYDNKGNRIVPMSGTVLWAERKSVIAAVEVGGDYDKLWDAYNKHFQRAVGRRINLKRKR